MGFNYRSPSVGVEEEYQLVEPTTGILSPQGQDVLAEAKDTAQASIQFELHLEQIEMASPVLNSSDEVRGCLTKTRNALMDAAESNGSAIVAAGTNPLPLPEHVLITPKPRYVQMEQQYQVLARELIIFGCHVHVDMPDRELGVQVINYTRPWLPVLQAISANSPYWDGKDTGYASYRRKMWVRWPMSGIPHLFKDSADYDDCVNSLLQAGAINDATKIYWDTRLPERVPTIEFRVFDVQTEIEDCVALVAITKALVMRSELAALRNEPLPATRHEMLRAAIWRAARYGISEKLIDPFRAIQVDALDHFAALLDYIAEPLSQTGDEQVVYDYAERLKTIGSPADRQRRIYRASDNQLDGLVQQLIARTAPLRGERRTA